MTEPLHQCLFLIWYNLLSLQHIGNIKRDLKCVLWVRCAAKHKAHGNKEQTFNAAKPLAKLFLFSLTTHHQSPWAYAAQKHTATVHFKQKTKIRFVHVLDEYKGRFINSQTSGELLTFVTSASRWPCWERALPVKHNFNWGMRRASCIKGDIPLKNGLENASSRQRTQKFDIVQGEILNTKPSMCLSRWSWAIYSSPPPTRVVV